MKTTIVEIDCDGERDEMYTYFYKCKNCKFSTVLLSFKFCPKCGLKIRRFEGTQK